GFIVLMDDRGARIVADGLGYTNEVQLSEDGGFLYVNETFGRRMTRFRVTSSGDLIEKTTITEFGPGTFPDGLAFDSEGCIWVTSIVSNRVIRVDPSGAQEIVLEDSDPDHLDWVEGAFQAGQLGRPHLDNIKSNTLMNISSLAFGGSDLKDIYLGCLLGDQVAKLRSPVAGRTPEHWHFDV
nr:SMP-30/gluconolactonase/LRE family protein [Arenicellales bacterium]